MRGVDFDTNRRNGASLRQPAFRWPHHAGRTQRRQHSL